MRRLLVMNQNGSVLRFFDVRCGLPMRCTGQAKAAIVPWQFARYASQKYPRGMLLTPDKRRLLLYGYQMGFAAYDDIGDLVWHNSLIEFTNNVSCGAVTNDVFIVCGESPFFYCYKWSDRVIIPYNTEMLGSVYSVCLSVDCGTLFMHHSIAPNFRAYNLASKEYADAQAAIGGNINFAYDNASLTCCTNSGAFVVNCKSVSPYISIFDAETLGVVHSINNPNYAANLFSDIMPHPHEADSVIVARGEKKVGNALMLNINCSSGAVEEIGLWPELAAAYSGVSGWQTTGMTYSKATDEIFVALTTKYTGSEQPQSTRTGVAYAIAVLDAHTLAFKRQEWVEDEGLPLTNHFNTSSTAGVPNKVKLLLVEDDIHQITGTVRDINNAPCARTVRAFRRSDGVCMAQTQSDAATGDYRLLLPDAGPYDVQFQALDGEKLNDLIFARSEPEPIEV